MVSGFCGTDKLCVRLPLLRSKAVRVIGGKGPWQAEIVGDIRIAVDVVHTKTETGVVRFIEGIVQMQIDPLVARCIQKDTSAEIQQRVVAISISPIPGSEGLIVEIAYAYEHRAGSHRETARMVIEPSLHLRHRDLVELKVH